MFGKLALDRLVWATVCMLWVSPLMADPGDSFSFVVIADPHVRASHYTQNKRRLEQCVDWVNAHQQWADIRLVFVAGDIGWDTHEGGLIIEEAKDILDGLDVEGGTILPGIRNRGSASSGELSATLVSLGDGVVIVDNASSDESLRAVFAPTNRGVPIEVVHNDVNLGFGTACNQGARFGSGDYVLFLNPDVTLAPGNLDAAASEALHELLQRLRAERGATFLIATHDPELARRSDRIVELQDGHLETVAGIAVGGTRA